MPTPTPVTMTRAAAQPILKPDEVFPLLIEPVVRMSVLGQIATTVYTDRPTVTVPKMNDIDVADWIPEGLEIPLDTVDFSEMTLEPSRLVGGSVVTKELIEDSSPVASELIGQSLARDLATKVDVAFFGAKGTNAERPAGLADLTGYSNVTAATVNLTPFFDAEIAAEAAGAPIDAYVCNPITAAEIGKLTLTGTAGVQDMTQPARRLILGVPVISSPNVAAGTIWGINRDSLLFVIRTDAEVEADSSVFFLSYRIALRSRIRCTWGFTNPAAAVRIKIG